MHKDIEDTMCSIITESGADGKLLYILRIEETRNIQEQMLQSWKNSLRLVDVLWVETTHSRVPLTCSHSQISEVSQTFKRPLNQNQSIYFT